MGVLQGKFRQAKDKVQSGHKMDETSIEMEMKARDLVVFERDVLR